MGGKRQEFDRVAKKRTVKDKQFDVVTRVNENDPTQHIIIQVPFERWRHDNP